MSDRRLLTPNIIDQSGAPQTGEHRIADTQVPGFGLRLSRSGGETRRAFDVRGKTAKGTYSRRTFKPWQDARPAFATDDPTWSSFHTHLSAWLPLARAWATDELCRMRGVPTQAEVQHAAYEAECRVNADLSLSAYVDKVLAAHEQNGWSEARRDAISKPLNLIPQPLQDRPMTLFNARDLFEAMAANGRNLSQMSAFRTFLSGAQRTAPLLGPYGDMDARNNAQDWDEVLGGIWSDAYQTRLSQYEPLVPKVLEALKEDPDWIAATALRLYLLTGATQAATRRARMDYIIDGHWYPHHPNDRASWFWAREALNEDLMAELQAHHAKVRKAFGPTPLLFPRRVGQDLQPISSMERAFRRVLKKAGYSRPNTVPLSEFARVSTHRTAASFQYRFSRIFAWSEDHPKDANFVETRKILSRRARSVN